GGGSAMGRHEWSQPLQPIWRAAALAAVLCVASFGLGQPRDQLPQPRVAVKDSRPPSTAGDADGISLPDGAVARLGSARFRYSAETTPPVAFSPDGKLLAIASRGVFLFDVATGRLVHHLQLPDGYWPQAVRFLADRKRIAVGAHSSRSGTRLAFFTLGDGRLAAAPDFTGQRALLLESGKQVYLWDLKSGPGLRAVQPAPIPRPLPLTPDEKWFAVTSMREAELRDADTGKLAAKFPDPGRRFQHWHSAMLSVGPSLSPDGRLPAWAGP